MSLSPEWCSWFAGLVDGEGCFTIRRNRGRWHAAELRVNMRADDVPMMREIKATLGFGRICKKEYHSTYRHPMIEYRVARKRDLLALVRLFDRYPLRSRKRKDYEVWRTFVLLHQDRKNATDPRLEELFNEIRTVRDFEESR